MQQFALGPLLSPRSIAIVGASADLSKTSARPLQYLINGGYEGRIYPINQRAEEILGLRAWPSVSSLPEIPDLAYILLPTVASIAAVAECGAKGIKTAVVLASGFSEAGTVGAKLEAELVAAARDNGIRLIGPSSLGLVNMHDRIVLTGNAAFVEKGIRTGGIFCASQSGSMIGALMSRGRAKGIGFAGFVSVGSECDLSLGAICQSTLDDDRITSYMLFLETIRDPNAIRRFAVEAARRGKPIVALKLGRSAAAAEIAVTHTGALAGDDDVVDSFLADCGIARVDTLEGLLEAPALLKQLPIANGESRKVPSVGVVTTTGGGAALVVDQLGIRGISVDKPSDATYAAIRKAGADAEYGRIVDLTLSGVRYDVMMGSLEAMLAAPEFDLVIATVGSSARFQPELAVKPIVDMAKKHSRLAAFLVPEAPEALAMLVEASVPCFRTPEACADAVAAALRRKVPREMVTHLPNPHADMCMLDEQEGYFLLDQIGMPHAAAVATDIGSPQAEEELFPAVVKILHRDIAHKSDIGGVVLNVRSQAELEVASRLIAENARKAAPGIEASRVLVQKMAKGAIGEVLIGYRIDKQVGPVVVLASGGTATEIYKDRCVRIAPVDLDTAYTMISEVKGLRLLTGFRNRPRGDVKALAEAIVSFSQLASRHDVVDMEVNPVLVLPEGKGVLAVDVLARCVRPDNPSAAK